MTNDPFELLDGLNVSEELDRITLSLRHVSFLVMKEEASKRLEAELADDGSYQQTNLNASAETYHQIQMMIDGMLAGRKSPLLTHHLKQVSNTSKPITYKHSLDVLIAMVVAMMIKYNNITTYRACKLVIKISESGGENSIMNPHRISFDNLRQRLPIGNSGSDIKQFLEKSENWNIARIILEAKNRSELPEYQGDSRQLFAVILDISFPKFIMTDEVLEKWFMEMGRDKVELPINYYK